MRSLCLIWGQGEQDEAYSTREMIEGYTEHLPAPAANVCVGWRFSFGEEKYLHARPTCSHASFLLCVPSLCLEPFPWAVLGIHVQGACDSFNFCSPGGIQSCGVPVVLTQPRSSANTHKSLSRAATAFTPSCFPPVGLGPSYF